MKNFKRLTSILLVAMIMVSSSTVAFAEGGSITEPQEVEYKESTKPLTPDGNLTLVDDINSTDEEDKQFITAVTKDGNYFYLVIDRSGNEDNVYLLNMVDEADLMSLMNGEPVTPELPPEPKPEVTPVPVPEEEPKKSTLPLLMLVLAMCGGGAFYYLKFEKDKNSHKGDTDVGAFDDENTDYDLEEVFDNTDMKRIAKNDANISNN